MDSLQEQVNRVFWTTLIESGLIGPRPPRKQQHNPAKAKRIDDLFRALTVFNEKKPSDYVREILSERADSNGSPSQ
jgi:hypothetical protein